MPAWNEASTIGATIRELRTHQLPMDILVVDDGSSDNSGIVASGEGATVLTLPFNVGVGGAMRTGFEYAHRNGYTRAIQVDADGQHDPADIIHVLEGLDHANISIGARFTGNTQYKVHGPRRWAMRLLAAVVSRLAHTRLTDVTSGFRAADEKAIDQYRKHYPAEYLGDTVDSLVMAIRSGLTVRQVPVQMRVRQGGVPSTSPLKSAVYLGRSLLALTIALTRKPMVQSSES